MNEVYVIAGGEWLRNNLNAIAAFMGTRTWDSIEKIALTLSVLAVAVMWVQRHNVMDLLGWVYQAEDRMERLALVACLLAVIPALNLATSNAAAVAGLVMTVLTVGLVSCAGKSLPRFWSGDFFPTFYACHLAVLGVLAL